MQTFISAIKYISIGSPLLPFILYIYLRNYQSKVINFLGGLVLVSGLSDILSLILTKKFHASNAIINNVQDVIQFMIVTIMYYHIYLKRKGSYKLILISLVVVIILLNTIFWRGIDSIQNLNWAITSLLIIAMAFGHTLYMNRFPVSYISHYAPHWITTGLLFYCTLSFAIFALSKFFIEDLKLDADFRYVWMFHNLNNIFKNACFFLAIWWSAYRDPAWDEPQTLKN
jgi:hypothetical protein